MLRWALEAAESRVSDTDLAPNSRSHSNKLAMFLFWFLQREYGIRLSCFFLCFKWISCENIDGMESKARFEDASNWQRRETPNSKNRWRSLCFHEHVLRTLLTICPSPPLSPTFYSRPLDPVAVFHEYQMTSHPPPRPRQESTVFCFRAMRGTKVMRIALLSCLAAWLSEAL